MVKGELSCMETLEVTSKLDRHTYPWFPKRMGQSGYVLLWNPSIQQLVLRKAHPLHKVDDTLTQLLGVKVFSNDANSRFWHIAIEKSQHQMTFITSLGHFHKMPFGISSALEHFQKRMKETLNFPVFCAWWPVGTPGTTSCHTSMPPRVPLVSLVM